MKRIVMLGTRPDTMGGISAVIAVYRAAGLFERWPIHYIATHRDGSAAAKALIAGQAWLRLIWMLLTNRVAAVHVHMASRASFWRKALFLLPAALARVPSIIHLHGAEFAVFWRQL